MVFPRIRLAVLAIACSSVSAPLAAQVEARAVVGAFDGYVWRGLSLTNRPVLQPSASLSVHAGGVTLTGSAWANVEPFRYNRARDLSQGNGASPWDVTEADYTLELAGDAASIAWALGGIAYDFPNDPSRSPVFNPSANTFEAYGRIGTGGWLAPTVTVYYDVDKVKGAYIEATASHTVSLAGHDVGITALGAWSAGQSGDFDPEGHPRAAAFAFRRDGLTQVDVSASATVEKRGLTFTPSVHVVYAADPFVRVVAPGVERTIKAWLGLSVARAFSGRASS